MIRNWPSCDEKQLKQHIDEYRFREDAYAHGGGEYNHVFDGGKKDRQNNIDTYIYTYETIKELREKCELELKEVYG